VRPSTALDCMVAIGYGRNALWASDPTHRRLAIRCSNYGMSISIVRRPSGANALPYRVESGIAEYGVETSNSDSVRVLPES